jgi:transposase
VLSFASSVRVFLAVEPVDMRKGFEGLHALAGERLSEDVRSGALFVFTNKRHTRLKMLYFDGTGLWCCGGSRSKMKIGSHFGIKRGRKITRFRTTHWPSTI